jgi:hypothetical protein
MRSAVKCGARPATKRAMLDLRALGLRALGLRALGLAPALVMALCAGRADASCAIAFEGDPSVVERVRAELGSFSDDGSACVALWVQCQQNGDQLQIDLHDELGRSALHLFSSAVGAAAFLVSWSRRPVGAEPGAPPGTSAAIERQAPGDTAPRPLAAPTPPTDAEGWRAELDLDYLATSDSHGNWGELAAAMINRAGLWRYGAEISAIAGKPPNAFAAGIATTLGVAVPLSPRVTASGDAVAGEIVVGNHSGYDGDYAASGPRVGIRARMTWQMTAPIGLAVSWGYDLAWLAIPSPSTGNTFRGLSHLAFGVQWVP